MKKFLLNEAIKNILVNMAIDGTLPSDMTQLDIHSIVDKAEKDLSKDPQYIRVCKIEKLDKFVSPNEDLTTLQMLDTLEAHENPNEISGWVDGVQMGEPYQTSFTVAQLLEEISTEPYETSFTVAQLREMRATQMDIFSRLMSRRND